MEKVELGKKYNAYNIRVDDTNEPIEFNKQAVGIHFNEDGDYLLYDYGVEQGERFNGIQGFSYDTERFHKITRNESVGTPTTEFTVTDQTNDIFRYTWNTVGVDPEFDVVSTAVGTKITIIGTDLTAGNEGEFEIVSRGTNYLEIENENGVVEENKAIGVTGGFILHAVPKDGFIRLTF